MKFTKIAFALISLLGSASAFAAPVGKVLTLAGNVAAERNGQRLPLTIGASLENGDILQVGPSSVAQIRFVDESIVSLRANTTFKIDDFRYTNTAEDRSVFGLIKGGMRTITGLIGKNNPQGYSVNGVTATIGIRGTHFTIVSCDVASPCTTLDNQTADEGMYGGVTDGRIAVINDAGDFEFAQQEYFHVASRSSAPRRLLAPPFFLSDGFETAARGLGSTLSALGALGQENELRKLSDLAAQGDYRHNYSVGISTSPQPTSLAAPPAPLPEASVPNYTTAENLSSALSEDLLPTQRSPIVSGDGQVPTATSGQTATFAASNPANSLQHSVESVQNANVVWDNQGFKSASQTFYYVDRNKARNAERGADGGVLEWGRWVGGPVLAGGWFNNITFDEKQGMHYVVGQATANMPTVGTNVAYELLGATAPTFADGIGAGLGIGNVKSASASVNFTAATLSAEWLIGFSGSNEYRLSMSSAGFSGATVNGTGSMAQTAGSTNVCAQTGCSARFEGFFAGDLAKYLALGYDVNTDASYFNGISVFHTQGSAPNTTTETGVRHVEAFASATGGTNVISESLDHTMSYVLSQKTARGGYQTVTPPGGESFYWSIQDQSTGDTGYHQAWGVTPVNLPTSGTATYSLYGHSTPTDNFGRTGSLSSASMTVNFANQTMTANTSTGINLTFGASGSLPVTMYQMSINNVPINNNVQTVPTTCTGCYTGSSTYGGVNLSFAGTNGQAVLGAIAVQGSIGSTAPQTHVGAASAIWAKPTP